MIATETTLQTAQEITLGVAVETFLEVEMLACSAQTDKWYRARLRLFITALGSDKLLDQITEKDLITWWKSLEKRTSQDPPSLSVETMHGYVRAARRLFKWLYDKHITVMELWPVLKLPTLPEQFRKGTNDNDVRALLDAVVDNPRDRAILYFIESTGCRRAGVAGLKLSDMNLSEPAPLCRRAIVREKGKKTREVMLSPDALEAMRAWMKVRKSRTDYVFVDVRPGHDRKLAPGGISQVIERYKDKLGITGRVSPHQWRHRYCRTLLKRGMPLNIVSQLAGHKSIVVTAKFYGNLLTDELQESFDRYYQPPK